ncbi:hypothetical protein DIPPA_11889 [Diplonema papillatum]|nr:hypothetical protein DIPPA_11889 [Diplonema papillatum]
MSNGMDPAAVEWTVSVPMVMLLVALAAQATEEHCASNPRCEWVETPATAGRCDDLLCSYT